MARIPDWIPRHGQFIPQEVPQKLPGDFSQKSCHIHPASH